MTAELADLRQMPTTSAGGAMRQVVQPHLILVGGALSDFGTAAQSLCAEVHRRLIVPLPATVSSLARADRDQEPPRSGEAIAELRRITGLTWEQLAGVFGVARRSLHFWASGKPLNAPNEERLRRLLAVVRRADRGAADINRALLLRDHDGLRPIDLLTEGRYGEFLAQVGEGPSRRRPALEPLSREAREARRPPPPEELVGGLHDPAHSSIGRGRAARTVRNLELSSGAQSVSDQRQSAGSSESSSGRSPGA